MGNLKNSCQKKKVLHVGKNATKVSTFYAQNLLGASLSNRFPRSSKLTHETRRGYGFGDILMQKNPSMPGMLGNTDPNVKGPLNFANPTITSVFQKEASTCSERIKPRRDAP